MRCASSSSALSTLPTACAPAQPCSMICTACAAVGAHVSAGPPLPHVSLLLQVCGAVACGFVIFEGTQEEAFARKTQPMNIISMADGQKLSADQRASLDDRDRLRPGQQAGDNCCKPGVSAGDNAVRPLAISHTRCPSRHTV